MYCTSHSSHHAATYIVITFFPQFRDTMGDVVNSTFHVSEFICGGVSGFIGPEHTCQVESTLAAAHNLPMISYVSFLVYSPLLISLHIVFYYVNYLFTFSLSLPCQFLFPPYSPILLLCLSFSPKLIFSSPPFHCTSASPYCSILFPSPIVFYYVIYPFP